jgi:hypothetical protein
LVFVQQLPIHFHHKRDERHVLGDHLVSLLEVVGLDVKFALVALLGHLLEVMGLDERI